ncbi:2,3-bisphosphoglycerate-independent phosphoglycerate mutase [Peptoniphilus sp. GNH]|nr:2,3-bisphosphoglycerate-independent phosphoglycerate mutase, form [Clostridiales bacterium KA00134]UHR02433.1 2,3-bisphosphoglycerate-independent phosphoglycerate mutase [Peptoniphilus sp. GNH]
MNRKILLAIADGLGDWPCKELGGKTPLEYANKPNLDALAKEGCTGIMDVYSAGVPVGTDLGHLILFGYGIKDYPGRGPIEAAGVGIDLEEGDVAFRCNFATIDQDGKIIDRRAGRIREGAQELAQALDGMVVDDVRVIFKAATEHRAVMVLRGDSLSDKVGDTDPKDINMKIKAACPKDDSLKAERTCHVLNKILLRAQDILAEHEINKERRAKGLFEANCILTRGAGQLVKLNKRKELASMKTMCVASEKTVLGVARLLGYQTLTDDEFTGNIDTNIEKKAKFALQALDDNDFVILHYKATDLMGHDGNPEGKVDAIEVYDKLLGLVTKGLEEKSYDTVLALAADHSTPCYRKEHSGDPVPVLMKGAVVRKDAVKSYDEISCAEGGLGRIQGSQFANLLFDFIEKTKKQGN